MAFENGVVQFALRTPLCVPSNQPVQRMLLDAMLTRRLIDRHGGDSYAAEGIAAMEAMLAHWAPIEGVAVPQASQCLVEAPALSGGNVVFVRDIFRTVTDHATRETISGVNWRNTLDTIRRPYKVEPNRYEEMVISSLWYFFRGEIDAIRDVLNSGSRHIGPLRAKGGCEIERVEVTAVPVVSDLFGIVCGGKLVRPVPARCEAALLSRGPVDYVNGMVENWHIPYFESANKELCLVPRQEGRHMVLTMYDLKQLAA